MKVIFSDLAVETLQEIVDFLKAKWTDKEISVLENDIELFVEYVQKNYKIFPVSKYHKNVREALIGNKQVKIFFEIAANEIHILLFWPNKANPEEFVRFLTSKI